MFYPQCPAPAVKENTHMSMPVSQISFCCFSTSNCSGVSTVGVEADMLLADPVELRELLLL